MNYIDCKIERMLQTDITLRIAHWHGCGTNGDDATRIEQTYTRRSRGVILACRAAQTRHRRLITRVQLTAAKTANANIPFVHRLAVVRVTIALELCHGALCTLSQDSGKLKMRQHSSSSLFYGIDGE